jgi:hypothetical protein
VQAGTVVVVLVVLAVLTAIRTANLTG